MISQKKIVKFIDDLHINWKDALEYAIIFLLIFQLIAFIQRVLNYG